ncbi:hypothetical protein ACJIZ3_012696 [Penstemon smallii]|uniref:Photosynthetic NDH subcomplex L 3 n=1 Tax=Penstemon smallii TaxID=265156 RepID=A0ABD3UMT4_9LAMI
MATTANLNAIFESLPSIPKPRGLGKIRKKAIVRCLFEKKKTEIQDNPVHATRRLVIGLASVALFGSTSGIGNSLAEDNGFWLTGPLPVPYAKNNINNEETGTRSFLKKGIYIANIGTKGRMHRLKRYAFDLIALGDLIAQRDAWTYVRRFLRFKCTFMYFDFDEVISATTAADDKKSLTDLANRLFDSVEKLLVAVKEKDYPQTESCYKVTTSVVEEVMARMA